MLMVKTLMEEEKRKRCGVVWLVGASDDLREKDGQIGDLRVRLADDIMLQ